MILQRDFDQAIDNLTSVQKRCSELLNENRAMRMAAQSLCDAAEWKHAVEKALAALAGKS